jgi:bacterioferritin
MVFGYNRIPIVSWLNTQATESLVHARAAGEMITHFGEHPSLRVGTLLETHQHDIENILRESMEFETTALQYYHHLLDLVVDRSILLEELVPVTKLDVFSWILLYNISSPVTESNQYVFRKY